DESLCSGAAHAKLFVQICRLHGDMHEVFAAQRAALRAKTARVAAAVAAPTATPSAEHSADAAPSPAAPPAREDLCPEAPTVGADTVVRDLSGEDTAHPTRQPPEQSISPEAT